MKKILLICITLFCLVCCFSVAASAAELPEVCEHCQKPVTWQPVTEYIQYMKEDGHYYLAFEGDTLETTTWNIEAKVCLYMNGKTLVGEKRIFSVTGQLNLMGEGTAMSGGYASSSTATGGVVSVSKGEFNLYGPTVKAKDEMCYAASGGVVYCSGGRINVYSGKILGGQASKSGGTLYLRSSTGYLYGGEIGGGTAAADGGSIVLSTKSTLTIDGATILAGTATGKGGSIVVAAENTLNLISGTVIGGSGKTGDSIHATTPSVLNISGGTVTDGAASGIYLENGSTMNLSGSAVLGTVKFNNLSQKPLTISGAYTGSFKLAASSSKYLVDGYVVGVSDDADLSGAKIKVDADDMKLCVRGDTLRCSLVGDVAPKVYEAGYCPVCETEVLWELWDEERLETATRMSFGHHKASFEGDSAYMSVKSVGGSDYVCFDMNGKTITADRAFVVDDGTLNLMDTVGGGKIVGHGPVSTSSKHGGTLYIYGGCTVNLYSGTLTYEYPTDGRACVNYGGVVYVIGNFNIYGGKVFGGAAKRGANIYGAAVSGGVGKIGIYGGEVGSNTKIPDGTSTTGPCILACGTVTLGGSSKVTNIRFGTTDYAPAYADRVTVLDDFCGSARFTAPSFNGACTIGYSNVTQGLTVSNSGAAGWHSVTGRLVTTGANAKVIRLQEDGTSVAYESFTAAVADTAAGDKLVLLENLADDAVVNGTVFVDLNGYNLSGNITGAGTLVCADYATADFTVADGKYGKLSGTVTCKVIGATPDVPQAEDHYLMLREDSGITFHRLQLKITNSVLRPSCAGIYYQAEILGDEKITPMLAQVGVAMNAAEAPTVHNFETTSLYTVQAYGSTGFSTLLSGVMKKENTDARNEANAATPVYAAAYVTLTDGTLLLGGVASTDMKSQAAAIDADWYYITTPQKLAYTEMYRAYRTVMVNWETTRVATSADVLDRYENEDNAKYVSAWDYNVVEQAKADGKIHYYFISSEGYVFKPTSKYPKKSGDCCLVVFPNGQTMLIDSSWVYSAKILVQNLQRMGITHLDYVLISHPHEDHQNGIFHEASLMASGFLQTFTIGEVMYRGGHDPESIGAYRVPLACEEFGIPYRTINRGDVMYFGEVKMTCLWPLPGVGDVQITGGLDINDNSIVVRFDYGEHSALFTGDLYSSTGEARLMQWTDPEMLDVDMLKVPHHAHNTSSSLDFLEAVSPQYAVATGYIESPAAVYTRFDTAGITLLQDTTKGHIHIASGADGVMTYETSRTEALEDVPVGEDDEEESE